MNRTFIIAEAGVNHNGKIENAIKLIDAAAEAGADAVKFQTFKAQNIVCRNAKKAEYQKQTTDADENQYMMLKKLELTEQMHEQLLQHCRENGILFLSTPFDLDSIDYLDRLGISIMKVPSGEITNYPYLKKIAETGKKVIMSTGMCTVEEVEAAVNVLKKYGSKDISLLHCNTEYPTPFCDVNLSAMTTLKNQFDLEVGYSDHTFGIEIPVAAVAMGATIIEKHFTLDKNMEGPDHKASLEPEELKQMVNAIRNVESALGNGMKTPSASEKKNIEIARKSIVAKKNIAAGEAFTEENLTAKRPGNGISPMKWNEIIGTKAKRDFAIDEMIEV